MTLITFQDGKPVMRDGKVGIGQECCCGCSRCIRNGEWDCQYTTQAECEDCVRTYQCYERVQTECDGGCPEGFDGPATNVSLTFSSTGCGGYGGTADVVIGCGQILSATVTDGGSGYAVLGRVAPTITATAGGSGSGAALSVTLAQEQDSCGVDYWRVSAVTVSNGGTGYSWGDPVSFTPASGDAYEYGAFGWSVEVDDDGVITGVVAGDGGYYYREDAGQPAYALPVAVSVSKPSGEPGSGATFTANVSTTAGETFGKVTSVTVTDGGSGYVSLCDRTRQELEDCSDCLPRTAPEFSECTVFSEEGVCGDWQGGFSFCDPPCCDSCVVRTYPWPPSPTRTCVPTLDVTEETSNYLKTSGVSGPPPEWWGPIAWNEEWLAAHENCTLVWVTDYVTQKDATGVYCGDRYSAVFGPNDPIDPEYVPPDGCYVIGRFQYCPTYKLRHWVRMRLFIVDCRDRTLHEVTDEALAEPIEWESCVIPQQFECSGGICGFVPICDGACDGANPGFLNPAPELACDP